MKDVDPCFAVYDALLQEARNDIINIKEIDILNDLRESVEVYGNYMCTSLDYTPEAQRATAKVIKRIAKADRTPAINWLLKELNL